MTLTPSLPSTQPRILVLAAIAMLSGCLAAGNISDTAAVDQKHGVLVTAVHSNYEGYKNILTPDLRFRFRPEGGSNFSRIELVLSEADELKVISLPIGKYQWESLMIGNSYLLLDKTKGFEIQPNKVTYIW
ncbi:MAG: hypothetical protein HY080_03885 [Gammaproteobacteria bacterium]|nr:hypothetical protein [Gammaproteobacteria bacterium]